MKRVWLLNFALIFMAMPLCAQTIYYVRAPGDCPYSGNGANWNCASSPGSTGAFAGFPATLDRADSAYYLVAGSSNTYASNSTPVAFNTPTGGIGGANAITIYKAVDCSLHTTVIYCPGGSSPIYKSGTGPQTVANWSASMGTTAASFVDAQGSDPIYFNYPSKVGPALIQFTTGYWVFDGAVGTALPSTPGPITTPTGQGFVIGSPNDREYIEFADGSTNQSNITLNHLSIGAVSPAPYLPAAVTACSWNSSTGVATITTSSDVGGDANPVVYDTIDGWTSAKAQIDWGTSGGVGIVPNSISWNGTAGTVVVTPASGGNPCGSLYPGGYIALNFLGPAGVYDGDNTGTLSNIIIENSYIHDGGLLIWLANTSGVQILHNYLARNHITPANHGSPVEITNNPNSYAGSNLTVAGNFFVDGIGTGWVTLLNSTGSTFTNAEIYDNIWTCSATAYAGPQAAEMCGGAVFTDNGAVYVSGSTFHQNTLYDVFGGGMTTTSTGSSGNTAMNNLVVDGGYVLTSFQSLKGGSTTTATHDYNTLLPTTATSSESNGTRPGGVGTCNNATYGGNEVCNPSSAVSPFVNAAAYDFRPTTPFNASSNGNTQWAAGTNALGSPYTTDFFGKPFGVNGYDRGAVAYASLQALPHVSLSGCISPCGFGAMAVRRVKDGAGSEPRILTLTNTGGATLMISSIQVSRGFGVSSTCGASLASLASCTITLTRAQTGSPTGTLTVTTNAASSPDTVSVKANEFAISRSTSDTATTAPNVY